MSLSQKIATSVYTHKINAEELSSVLKKYKMSALLPEIKKILNVLERKDREGREMKIETPFPLGDEALLHLKKKVAGEDVHHRIVINKNLLAGWKATHNNTLYDASAERIIKQFISK